MVKALIFDCFGVLTGDKWKAFVGSLPKDQHEAARELNRSLNRRQITLQEFLQQVQELTGRSTDEVSSVINAEMYKNQTLLHYIASLKPRYKIGLLSNVSTDWIRTHLLTPTDIELFDDLLLSYEVGTVKPELRAYELSAKRLGVEISECVLIDDSIRNYEGAKKAGMQAILYKDFDQMREELEKIIKK